MNPNYPNPDPIDSKTIEYRYKNHIWTDVDGVTHYVTHLEDDYLLNIVKLLQKDLHQIINGYKAKDWLAIMLSEYNNRINSTVQPNPFDEDVPHPAKFPTNWTQLEPIMVRPSEREYREPRLVEYSETIYGKYHCVIELDLIGYRVGYVGVRSNHPAYKQQLDAISTSVAGGISFTTHQVATFRTPSIKMWYFAIGFNHEEDYPDVDALDRYKEYWAGTHDYESVENIIKRHNNAPGRLKGKGFFEVKDLNYVKQQLVQLILDLEQYEKDKTN